MIHPRWTQLRIQEFNLERIIFDGMIRHRLFGHSKEQVDAHLPYPGRPVDWARNDNPAGPRKSRVSTLKYQHRLLTEFLRAGQSPIVASSRSPAWIGPTPEGVPVKMTSPGKSVM